MIKFLKQVLTPFLFFVLIVLQLSSCRTEPKKDISTVINQNTKTVVIRLKNEPDYLIPILTTSSYSRKVFRQIHASLLELNPVTMDYAPKLLVSDPKVIPISKGALKGGFRYVFELRKEAKWDNGTPVLAEDVLFSFKSIINPKILSRYAPGINFVEDIIVDSSNPRKFEVLTNKCFANALIEIGTTEIYPKYYYDPKGIMDEFSFKSLRDAKEIQKIKDGDEKLQSFADFFKRPKMTHEDVLGAGAYKVKEWISGEYIILEKKENWWGTKFEKESQIFVNKPDKLIYKIVPDETTALTMAKAGEVDIVSEIVFENFESLKNNETAKKELSFFSPRTSIYYYLGFNTQREILKDKRVRRAVALITDVDYIIEHAMHGFGERIVGPIMPYSENYNKDLKLLKFDLDESSRLLDAAGWIDTDGDGWRDKIIKGKKTPLKIEFKIGSKSQVSKLISELLIKAGKKVGVKIDRIVMDGRKILTKDAPAGNFDMISLGARVHTPYIPYSAYHTDNFPPRGQNKTRFGNAESDAIIESIMSNCDDAEKRKKDYIRFQEIIYEEQPMIYLFNAKGRLIINKKFKGAKSFDVFPGYQENWLE